MGVLQRIWGIVDQRIGLLMDLVENAPNWVQTLWVFSTLGALGIIGFDIWYMQFGRVVIAAAVITVTLALVARWRWGPVLLVLAAGIPYCIVSRHLASSIMTTAALALLAAMFTLPQRRSSIQSRRVV